MVQQVVMRAIVREQSQVVIRRLLRLNSKICRLLYKKQNDNFILLFEIHFDLELFSHLLFTYINNLLQEHILHVRHQANHLTHNMLVHMLDDRYMMVPLMMFILYNNQQ